MGFDFHKPDFKLLKEIAVFSSFIALNQVVDQINWATDKVILGKVCSSTAVAVYAIGSQINTYYLQFSTAISGVFVPQVNRIVASNDKKQNINKQLTDLFIKVGRVQFIVLIHQLILLEMFLISSNKSVSGSQFVSLLGALISAYKNR